MGRPWTKRRGGLNLLGLGGCGLGLWALLSLLGWPRAAQAYRCTRVSPSVGPSLVWGVRTVPWWLSSAVADLSGGQGENEAVRSFAAWSDPECTDLTFPLAGIREDLISEYLEGGSNQNAVTLVPDWPYQPGAIALTTIAYDPATGLVLDADIELNGSFGFDVLEERDTCAAEETAMDLRNTLTHEVGHLVGLDHPPASERYADTTMFASAPPCETSKRSLAADDLEGLCAIYPAEASTRPCFPPNQPGFVVVETDEGYGCRAVSSSGHGRSRGGLGLLVAAVVLLGRRRFTPKGP